MGSIVLGKQADSLESALWLALTYGSLRIDMIMSAIRYGSIDAFFNVLLHIFVVDYALGGLWKFLSE